MEDLSPDEKDESMQIFMFNVDPWRRSWPITLRGSVTENLRTEKESQN